MTHPAGTTEPLAYPMRRTCPFSVPEGYAELREHPTVGRVELPTGALAWAVTRYEDVRTMLADNRFSSDLRHPGFPLLMEHQRPAPEFSTSLVGMDPPDHTLARRAVAGDFTYRRMNRLRPRIQEIVDEHVERLLAGPRPADLVSAFANPVPLMAICELIGVPFEDRDFFLRISSTVMNATSADEGARAMRELMEYMDALVTSKEKEPTDDVLGRLAARPGEPGVPGHRDMVGMAFMLLMAGHETPANVLGLGAMLLLERPEVLEELRGDPSRMPAAVDELLRYFTIAEIGNSRVALEDVELGGVTIRAGEGVLGLTVGANRDPARFQDPDRFDIARSDQGHVSFGYGSHQCLGQHLARIELEVAFTTLFARIPGLRLAVPMDTLRFKDEHINYGLHALPVTW
ncbi:MAG TPA: cytochrome P450 [Streptomyces sp.]|uniref:cytochrome P450 n=1 Tax=Streptomyces sp. TaxID=1931 RepID=UPI002CB88E4F|nr:cytochrome P450 [Streptomyces sp.]HWU10859.1 cytochrome P450 [Streptomyces sp.]